MQKLCLLYNFVDEYNYTKLKYVTREKVRLYKTCGCYVIINQTGYTRVLSIV